MKNLRANAQKYGKTEFSGKISKNLTPLGILKIKFFGKVWKISGHIMEKFQLFMEIYTPDIVIKSKC